MPHTDRDTATAPDGSPVALYARLPPLGEPEVIHGALPDGCEILELGAGAGRLTHALLALGHAVVAVDQSPEMLAHVRGAETVLADIETLALGRRFTAVVMASNFVNTPGAAARRALLASCARHVAPDGRVLLERMPPGWSPSRQWIERGGVRMRLRSWRRDRDRVSGEMEYLLDGRPLLHRFTAELVSDEQLAVELTAVGLRATRVLDERGSWVEAVPAAPDAGA